MAEEGLHLSPRESLLKRDSNSDRRVSGSSLLSEIWSVSTIPFVMSFCFCASSAFVFGCIIGYSAPTQSAMMKDLNLSVADYSLFGSILTIGQIVGALICGKLTDLIGRLYTMWITNILYTMGWFAIAFAKDAWVLDLGRLLHGVTIGIGSYLGPIYIAEITPKNLRGTISSLSQLFAGIGIAVFFAMGVIVSWRTLAFIGSIICIMLFPVLLFIPESPRWLAKVGKQEEFEATLLRLRGQKTDIAEEANEILEYTKRIKQSRKDGFFELFQRKYVLSLMIGVVVIALPQLGGLNAYTFYTDSIFTSAGVSSDIGFVTSSIVQLLTGVLGTALVDISGRRILLLFSQVGLFFGCLLTAISFFLQDHHCWEAGTPILALISVLVYFAAYSLGLGSIPWIIASEIYPVDVKGAAGTICNLVSSLSSWIVAYSFSFMLQWSSTGTFLIFACVSGFGIVFIAKLVPETKGKSLEEIQASLIY